MNFYFTTSKLDLCSLVQFGELGEKKNPNVDGGLFTLHLLHHLTKHIHCLMCVEELNEATSDGASNRRRIGKVISEGQQQ